MTSSNCTELFCLGKYTLQLNTLLTHFQATGRTRQTVRHHNMVPMRPLTAGRGVISVYLTEETALS